MIETENYKQELTMDEFYWLRKIFGEDYYSILQKKRVKLTLCADRKLIKLSPKIRRPVSIKDIGDLSENIMAINVAIVNHNRLFSRKQQK